MSGETQRGMIHTEGIRATFQGTVPPGDYDLRIVVEDSAEGKKVVEAITLYLMSRQKWKFRANRIR